MRKNNITIDIVKAIVDCLIVKQSASCGKFLFFCLCCLCSNILFVSRLLPSGHQKLRGMGPFSIYVPTFPMIYWLLKNNVVMCYKVVLN